jgi:hypothetical protein
MPDTILATTVDTPVGPLSLLACAEQLIAGGFTADPAELHARLHPSLRGLARGAAPPRAGPPRGGAAPPAPGPARGGGAGGCGP